RALSVVIIDHGAKHRCGVTGFVARTGVRTSTARSGSDRISVTPCLQRLVGVMMMVAQLA
ncbi:MAG: hypothetical protein M3Q82_06095, partial [Actinomycetota bacterium]|nr:hypothetical protein [Actinomycetota bacterium]